MDILINILIFTLVGLFFVKRIMPAKGVRQITTEQLKTELSDKNKQFIDVRTVGEYKGNKIKEFTNIPLHELGQKANQLNKEKEVIVICQSGMRSSKATNVLKKSGFKSVTNVKGGMSAWY